MLTRFLSFVAHAVADALYALGAGFRDALRPSMLVRSAGIAALACTVTLWLFWQHWNVAEIFMVVFMPVMMLGFGTTGAQSSAGPGMAAATTGGLDLAGGIGQLAHGAGALAHAAGALAFAALCGFLLCGLLLTLFAARRLLLPEAVRRARIRYPALQPVAEAPAAWTRRLWIAVRWIVPVLALTQLIHLAAVFVPHLGFLWLLLLAYLPVAFLAAQSLRGVATAEERSAVLRRQRGGFAILGLAVLASACVPVLNLLTPAVFAIGTARLSHRTLANLRVATP